MLRYWRNRRISRYVYVLIACLLFYLLWQIVFKNQRNRKMKTLLDNLKRQNGGEERMSPLRDAIVFKGDRKPAVFERSDIIFHTETNDEFFEELKRNKKLQNFVNYDVHAFYYAWYGTPAVDGSYYHWNHKYLPHWNPKVSAQYPTGQSHVPPDDIGSTYYPDLGVYSSVDEATTRTHMIQFQQAGIGVLALSWYPAGKADDNGKPVESYIPTIFNLAEQYCIKICFHIEPYKRRNARTVRDDIIYLINKYGDHPAFYKYQVVSKKKALPFFYVYDSYNTKSTDWKNLFAKDGEFSIRNSKHDAFVVGLLVEKKHIYELWQGGFDGMYTYFASNGFSYGSTHAKWKEMAISARQLNMSFIPSVGPGYDDTRVRPWNEVNSRLRENGKYYTEGWTSALSVPEVSVISITSFNEWHEGTQIEPASNEAKQGDYTYLTYNPLQPDYYLDATKNWSIELEKRNSKKR